MLFARIFEPFIVMDARRTSSSKVLACSLAFLALFICGFKCNAGLSKGEKKEEAFCVSFLLLSCGTVKHFTAVYCYLCCT